MRLVEDWYRPGLTWRTAPLVPLALLFGGIAAVRRVLYRAGVLRRARVGVPVVVVGNVTVGGTGKTPLVRALAVALRARGWRPGIVSRGYGARAHGPRDVRESDAAADVGDEPLLHARSGVPVAIGRDRVAAARHLLAGHPEVDVIVADDGLQHYALERDVEIVVLDAARGFGNGWLLPAGPLREPPRRAADAHARVRTARPGASGPARAGELALTLTPLPWRAVRDGTAVPDLAALPAGSVHAIAGIAAPERFFAQVAALGIAAVPHAFPDHHRYTAGDVALPGARAILMTEKDAVKCREFADDRMFWLPLRADVDPALVTLVEDTLHGSQAA